MRAGPALLALLLGGAAATAMAAGPEREIHDLIDALAHSDCQFERNGRWYDADRARAHLQRKHDWLRKRDLVTTPEQFIERAASRSSLSGKPYHVRCPGKPVQESGAWFDATLQRLRAADAASPAR